MKSGQMLCTVHYSLIQVDLLVQVCYNQKFQTRDIVPTIIDLQFAIIQRVEYGSCWIKFCDGEIYKQIQSHYASTSSYIDRSKQQIYISNTILKFAGNVQNLNLQTSSGLLLI